MLIRVNTNALEPSYCAGDVCEIATDIAAKNSDDVLVKDADGVLAIILAPAKISPGASMVGVVVERRRRIARLQQ